jgi:beta-glucosidase
MTSYLDGKAKVLYARGCRPYEDMSYEDILSLTKDFEKDNRSEDAMLKEALQIARQADVIVAALGESSEMSGESSSRSDINIPAPQQRLLKALAATGKPIVLVLFTGRPLTITWENEHIPAILNVWFPGTEAAYAVPDVLFGDINPSGKLTSTWAQNVGQIPIYYNIKNVSKPLEKWPYKFRSGYLDVSNEPLYPFGYGLSYTKFSYGTPVINDTVMRESDTLTVTVGITNSGQRDGAETVQFYIRDIVASTVRPNKELKGFYKVFLKAGETKEVQFKITSSLLKFYDYNLNFVCEKGAFEVMIGRNSADLQKVKFTLL